LVTVPVTDRMEATFKRPRVCPLPALPFTIWASTFTA
jgi:hypothetical protein